MYYSLPFLSGGFVVASYFAGYVIWKNKVWSEKRKQGVGSVIGAVFAVSLTLLADSLLQHMRGVSFLHLLSQGGVIPLIVYAAGCVQGIVYEYIGQFALGKWYYPVIQWKRFLLFVLPLFWGLFMLILQDIWTILRTLELGVFVATIATAIHGFVLIEGMNFFTRSWVYEGWGRSLLILVLGWVGLIITFVVGFNALILSPFGL